MTWSTRIRQSTRIFNVALLLLAIGVTLSACCDTKANIGVVRGKTISARELPGSLVVICPGEEVTLGWMTKEANSATVTDLGSVSTPTGSQIITPNESKDYQLKAKGDDCDASATANVIVVKAGSHFAFSFMAAGTAREATLHWEANLPELFYSPKVLVTSVRINAPPTLKGWSVQKVDLNGTVHQFQVGPQFSTPTSQPFQLPGVWKMVPVDPGELNPNALPNLVELEVTLDCGN